MAQFINYDPNAGIAAIQKAGENISGILAEAGKAEQEMTLRKKRTEAVQFLNETISTRTRENPNVGYFPLHDPVVRDAAMAVSPIAKDYVDLLVGLHDRNVKAAEPKSVSGGYLKPNLATGESTFVDTTPAATPKPSEPNTEYEDFREMFRDQQTGKVDVAKLNQAWTDRQIKVFGAKEEKKAELRPDKSERVEFIGADGKTRYGFFKTDPTSGKTTFEETAVEPPKSEAQTRITAGDRDFLTQAEGLSKIISDIESGYDESYVGPIQGRVGGIQSVTTGNTPEEASFRASVSSLKNQLLKMRSGAAVTPSEFDRILTELPNESDPEENFLAKLQKTKENINLLKTTRMSLQGDGARPSNGSSSTQISPADQEAIDWAKANPDDPRSAKILELHGVK